MVLTDITEAAVGKYVWYYDPGTNKGELGRIKTVTADAVFVVFGSLADLKDYTNLSGIYTLPERLTWSNKESD